VHGELSVFSVDQLDLCAGEVWRRGGYIQVSELDGAEDDSFEGKLPNESVVNGAGEVLAFETDAARGITLRITIYEQCSLLGDCQARCEVYSCRRLTDSALLICDRDYLGHAQLRSECAGNIDLFGTSGYT